MERTITTKTKAAKAAGVHTKTIDRMLKSGRITPYRLKGVATDQVCVEEVLEAMSKKMQPKEKIEEIKKIINK